MPGDRDELTRVFENLIENALKYGANGKRVDIGFSSATARGGEAETLVTVRDYGPGIAAEHIPRLTERFYRVDVTQSRAEGGTGLGLSLVKHILNRHRGRLTIESEAGNGATFTVRLPLIHSAPISARLKANPFQVVKLSYGRHPSFIQRRHETPIGAPRGQEEETNRSITRCQLGRRTKAKTKEGRKELGLGPGSPSRSVSANRRVPLKFIHTIAAAGLVARPP